MSTPRAAIATLRSATEDGRLDDLCTRHGIRVLTVFGSATSPDGEPNDLDVAIVFEPDTEGDVIAVVNALIDLTDYEGIDVMDAGRAAPVARTRALVEAEALYESEPGAYAEARTAALLLEWDTAWMRQLALETLQR
ncbi:MAG: nucleotidyltransferase domain-containing protein [Actinobacteria bacterium]|nr:nucleotidyltransferase domain-containing protein [Actinomycetota bacterium]